MKKVRFCEEQMVAICAKRIGVRSFEVATRHKLSKQTIYVWRRRFGKPEPADGKRLRERDVENAKLNHMIGERETAIETLKEINRRKWRARRSEGTRSL